MPAAADRYYTRDEVLAFPRDGNRYELVYGELLVSPAPVPRHQHVMGTLYVLLRSYVDRMGLGRAYTSPADISWSREDVIVQPDVFVVAAHDARLAQWDLMSHFLLFAEVLSPSTSRFDRFTKRRLYQHMRVPLYWVIDPIRAQAEIWTPDAVTATIATDRLTWSPEGVPEAFVVELAQVLAD